MKAFPKFSSSTVFGSDRSHCKCAGLISWADRYPQTLKVKHGIRMTPMPAFSPTHTDEEIWKVVAFIRHMPDLSQRAPHEGTVDSLTKDSAQSDHPAHGKH
jgi:hypothetical protein